MVVKQELLARFYVRCFYFFLPAAAVSKLVGLDVAAFFAAGVMAGMTGLLVYATRNSKDSVDKRYRW